MSMFLGFTTLFLGHYEKYIRNIQSCNTVLANRVKCKCRSLQMSLRNIFSATRNIGAENHLFYYRVANELLQKQLCLATDHQLMLRPCVEGLHTSHALHTKFRIDLYGSVRNYVQRFTDQAAFWNDWANVNTLSFFGMVQVFTEKQRQL